MEDKLSAVKTMIEQAEKYVDDGENDRERAIDYYQGKMPDMPHEEDRSSIVSRDVRSFIKKVLPSIMRTILGNDEVVEYKPMNEGDEDGANQASDYVNFQIIPESNAAQAIEDAIHDALLLKNGILKAYFDNSLEVSISRHTGLTEYAFADLVSDDQVEVIEHEERVEFVETAQGPVQAVLHDCKIRRTFPRNKICAAAVPRHRFLIHPDATCLTDSSVVGEKDRMTRSDLIRMGNDRDVIDGLMVADDDHEDGIRRQEWDDMDEVERSNQLIDFYDVYVRVDMDEDGISELRHMRFAGGLREKNLIHNEEVDSVQYYDLKVMSQPHQWEGISLFDDLGDIQQVKTTLLRQSLDNLYWQNNPQPVINLDMVENPDSILKPKFGQPIILTHNVEPKNAYHVQTVPFVAGESYAMLEYMDNEGSDRTGVNDASSGLAPDALQNMTAKASAMIEQAGIGQTEMLVGTIARGLEKFFAGLLQLMVRHQDQPRTIRLRDEWVEVDPRHWNAGMDCRVNTGLGAGTRERDMAVMQTVMGVQEKLLAAFGSDNPFVTPKNLYNAVAKMVESAGLRSTSMYFTEPDQQKIAQLMEAQRNKPNPEMEKLAMQKELEGAKLQANVAKENAQMQADLRVKEAEIVAESKRRADDLASKSLLQERELEFKREQLAQDAELRLREMELKRQDDAMRENARRVSEAIGAQNNAA